MLASAGTRVACGLCAIVVITAGCVHTTGGTATVGAQQTSSGAPTTKPDSRDSLQRILLGVADVNAIMGATDIELMGSANDMSDHSGGISEPLCLGALYNAEQSVYDKTGWTDIVDQVLTEPEDDSSHWVEQTAVKFPSPASAQAFLDDSFTQWTDCIGKTVVVNDGEYEFNWQFEGISRVAGTISQTARQTDSDGWACQHAMSAVDSVIVEVSACGLSLQDEAVTIVGRLAANVK